MFIFKVLQDIYNKYTLNVAVNAKNSRKVDLKIPGNTDHYIQIQNKQNKNDGWLNFFWRFLNKRKEKLTDTTVQHVDISENFVFETKSTYTFPSVMSKISVSVSFWKTNTLYLDLLTLLKTFYKNRNSVTEFQFFRNASDISSNGGVFHEKKDSSLIYASDLETPNAELPTQSKIVICGGGAQGAAIAYKLALKGML